MLDEGDLDGAAVWRRIVAVINEMQRSEPAVPYTHYASLILCDHEITPFRYVLAFASLRKD